MFQSFIDEDDYNYDYGGDDDDDCTVWPVNFTSFMSLSFSFSHNIIHAFLFVIIDHYTCSHPHCMYSLVLCVPHEKKNDVIWLLSPLLLLFFYFQIEIVFAWVNFLTIFLTKMFLKWNSMWFSHFSFTRVVCEYVCLFAFFTASFPLFFYLWISL